MDCNNFVFKKAFGKAIPYIECVALAMLLFMSYIFLKISIFASLFGLVCTLALAVLLYLFFTRSHYVVTDKEVILKELWRKEVYPIDGMTRIQYYDFGVEYSTGANNARYQVGIFFNPKVFKSFEPRAFCPVDRDGFTDAILSRNPDISVSREDIRPK